MAASGNLIATSSINDISDADIRLLNSFIEDILADYRTSQLIKQSFTQREKAKEILKLIKKYLIDSIFMPNAATIEILEHAADDCTLASLPSPDSTVDFRNFHSELAGILVENAPI